jgi:serine/threonine protein kinase
MRAFVATCLVMDPEKRPSSASLERNPWLKRACEPSGMLPLIQTLRDGGNSTGGCVIQ